LNEKRIIMKSLNIACTVLAVALKGGAYSARAETAGSPAKVMDGKKIHDICE
jgi:hypothetical protein